MKLIKTEGVVLQVVPFGERDQILSVFAPVEGILKMIVKQKRAASPLIQGEFIYRWGRGELAKCEEWNATDTFNGLRGDYATLEGACRMLEAVRTTQCPGRGAEGLYRLLIGYLNYLPVSNNPRILVASFRLKLLWHEGLLTLDSLEDELLVLTASKKLKEIDQIQLTPEQSEKVHELFGYQI